MKRAWVKGLLSIAASAACVVVAIGALQISRATEEGSLKPEISPDSDRELPVGVRSLDAAAFEGQIVALTIRGSTSPKLLAEARFEETGGRTFLVGKVVKSTSSIPLDADSHVAWDSVDAFYLFDSVEHYETAINKALAEAQGTVRHLIGDAREADAVQSVEVRIIDPADRLNGHGERLAEAVMKRIEEVTPFRVCSSNADSILFCAIRADDDLPAQESPDSGTTRKADRLITVEWTDRDGNLLQPGTSVSLPEIAPLSNVFPKLRQELTMEQANSLRNAAEQIVSLMEVPW